MDIKYTILDKYEISEDISVMDGKLYIPLQNDLACTKIMCDNSKFPFQLNIVKETGKDGKENFVVDFAKETELLDILVSQFLEAKEAVFSFSVFLLKELECHRIQDIRKENFLINKITSMEVEGEIFVLGVYFLPNGNMNMLFAKEQDLYRKNVNVYLGNINQKDSVCEISCVSNSAVMLQENGGKFARFELIRANGEERYMVPFSDCNLQQETEKLEFVLSAKMDFAKIPNLFASHWNLFCVIQIDEKEYLIPVSHEKKKKKINNAVLKESLEHPYREEGKRSAAYLDITKVGNVRIYTGDLNNATEYEEEASFESLIRNPEVSFSRELSAKIVDHGMGYMKVQLMEASLENVDEIALLVYKMASVHILMVPVEIIDKEAGILQVNTDSFSEICEGTGAAAFKFALAIRMGKRFMKARLLDKDIYIETMIGRHGLLDEELQNEKSGKEAKENVQDEHAIYMDNIFTIKLEDDIVDACPYTNNTGFFLMRMCARRNMSIYKIVCEALEINVSNQYLTIKAKCPGKDRKWTGFLLSYRYQKEEDKDDRFFAADEIKKTKDACVMSVKILLKEQNFKGIYWNVRPVFEENGDEYYASIKALKTELKESYKKLFQRNCKYYIVGKEKYILFPFVAKNGNINLMYRTTEGNDGFKFRMKERMGLRMYQLLEKKLKEQRIMLVYEKYCYMAGDNGYQFFKYCMENDMERFLNRKIYYVIDKKSPDYEKVKKYKKNVLDFMSVKFIAYMLAAKLLVSSDVRSHAYAWRHRSSIIAHVIQKKKHVFLQHGVTAMKKVDNIFGKSNNMPTNLFVVTSDEEYDIVSKYFGYNKNEIALTGFARWDVLEDKSAGRREILVMPTWRNWLDDADSETFRNSDYFKNYMQLLNSKRLEKILKENDVRMNFYIHPKFKDYIGNFQIDGERIRLIPFGTEPLNELMMQCNMLITDYSSVSWDVYYMKKPVLFYQFDVDTYNETHGSYMDMEHDLFGDRTLDLEELITLIEENIQNGFKLKAKYEEECKKHFKYMDKNNCKRICMVIKQKGY